MSTRNLYEWYKTMFDMHKRIIKPWKKRCEAEKADCYACGWNDCLKEMEKTHKKYMKHFDIAAMQYISDEIAPTA